MQYNSLGNDALDLQSVLRSRNQELEERLRSSQQELQHWKDAYMMLLPRIGPPSNQPATLSPIMSTVKQEFMMPSMHPKKLEPDASHMSPAEFIQTRNELLQALFDKAFISHENHVEKERYDYIYVQFWTFKEYDDSAKDAMEDTALSDKIAYLEDVKGKSVDIRRVKAIRSELRGIFKQISNNLARAIEPTWTRYDTYFQDAVYKHLRVKYPEFMLCEDNWKARSFMSNWYSNWTKNLKKAAKLGAPETEKGKGRATAKVIPAKRRIDDTVTASTSKRRLDHNSTSHEDESFSDIIIDVVPPQIQIISPL
ncbi:hypothetical protein M378DRAFT_162963 [Amanita muscaria Koide BX008]|uniref:Uncharacterized protein n=1 Tax=Amanita muscaria (strain Koide BX008) TaxID=946122 RepID=A0A0C2X726_AMAMK|nr:hypothetical protein M378DRAFT_162963 [Amanita muscaria Koide BX008]